MAIPLLCGNEASADTASELLKILSPNSLATLLATSKQLRKHIHDYASSLQLQSSRDIPLLFSHRWCSMTKLNLSNTGLDRQSISALVRGKLPTLQDLDLSENELSARSMQHLAKGQWPALTRLALARSFGFQMGYKEVTSSCRHLATSSWPALRVLELSHNLLSADGVAELSRACWPELITLGIRNTFDQAQVEDACRHLADSRWPKLTSLDVSQNPLSAVSVASLLKGQWSAVQTLSLESCFLPIDPQSIIASCRALTAGVLLFLRSLNIGHNHLGRSPQRSQRDSGHCWLI